MSALNHQPSILIVDDAPDMIVMMAKMLPGQSVCAARSGEEALDVLAKRRVDLILLDVNMPGMGGFGLLEHLRAQDRMRTIPVLVVTAEHADNVASQALQAGAADIVAKPVNPDVLRARVQTQLEAAGLRDTVRSVQRAHTQALQARTHDLIEAQVATASVHRANMLAFADMAHAIREPVAALMSAAQALDTDARRDAGAIHRRTLVQALEQLDDLTGRLSGVLDAAAGSATVSHVPLDLPGLLQQVVRAVTPAASEKGLSIDAACDPALAEPLRGDSGHLRAVLDAYVRNAIRHTADGRVHIRLSVPDEDLTGLTLRIEVQDEGPGMSPEVLLRVFDQPAAPAQGPWERLESAGVGLPVVARLCALMGGEVGCHAVPGQGARFWATARLLRGAGDNTPMNGDFQI